VIKQPASDDLGGEAHAGSIYNTVKTSGPQFFFY
jgi:hypothetical protein